MRVLYADHTTLVSGAERSLLELLQGLPSDVEPVLACPPGPLSEAAAAADVSWVSLPATAGSLKLHPVHTTVALTEFARIGATLRRTARRERADVIHANTLQAGVAAGLARTAGGTPLVAHVRDCLPAAGAAKYVRRWISSRADALIAISQFTSRCWGPGIDVVIPNAVDTERFNPERADGARVRTEFAIPADSPVMSVVAQITPWKGQSDAIETLAALRAKQPDARLLIVGETKFVFAATRYDNVAYLNELHALVGRYGLDDAVHFLGERSDIPDLMAASDLLLVPSWEEPFGRTIIEAMAMGLPAIATASGGPPEIIEDGVDGVLLPPREPERWAEAAAELLAERVRLAEMGRRGREKAHAQYGRAVHAARVVEVYRRLAA